MTIPRSAAAGVPLPPTAATANPPTRPRSLGDGPYVANELRLGCIGTRGGPATDRDERVLRRDGLYAAGNVAAGMFGRSYPGAGGTLGPRSRSATPRAGPSRPRTTRPRPPAGPAPGPMCPGA
ncbi:FAD-binding protein [Nocardia jiangxiensis]|uniref:FAD-binding protein n=1 Tax=Nocardia jiangxiensis TaxID=282685 RepID=A0ABW6SC01_9NOCA